MRAIGRNASLVPEKVYGMTAIKPVSDTSESAYVAVSSVRVNMQVGGK